MDRGLILNIQRYCVHDGPGIRTTVFLKGCPLRCGWCHNPESQPETPEVCVQSSRCIRCGCCVTACPALDGGQAVERAIADVPAVPDHCSRCEACVSVCPTGARQMVGREMTVAEVVAAVCKDRVFHDQSGGGVTLSGGEPLAQAEFSLRVLKALRDRSVHTAVDTSGFAPRDVVREVARWVDLFLYDLKSVDDRVHREQTGVSNAVILANLETLGRVHDNIWVRVPLIPGFNVDERQLRESARFVASVAGVRQVNVLPYHRMGREKRGGGGDRESPAQCGSAPTDELTSLQIERAARFFRAQGLCTVIGG